MSAVDHGGMAARTGAPSRGGLELDHALRAAAIAGKPGARERLVRAHAAHMLAAIQRVLGDGVEAREALQAAFARAFREIGRQGDASSRLAPWLHRLALDAALERQRGRRSDDDATIEPLLPRFDETDHRMGPDRDWSGRIEKLRGRGDARAEIRSRVASLPDRYRVVFLLRDVEGLGVAEVARMLGLPASTVELRLHRARQALLTLLDPLF